jgi:FKBP-type peptidyl-prolyl cis-trans isomerase FkpA/FKBP-type peptidyl-prolyl cis-trans isomerase FklB
MLAIVAPSLGVTMSAANPGKLSPAQVDSVSTAAATVFGAYIRNSVNGMRSVGLDIDMNIFSAALAKAVNGQETGMTPEDADKYINSTIKALRAPEKLSQESQDAFLKDAAAQKGAVTTASGLIFVTIKEGQGANPAATDKVKLTYTGRFSDGSVFDETSDGPIDLDVNRLVPGFTEALQLMKPGGSYRIYIPANLAYGSDGIPGAIPGNAVLDFEINLIDIISQ